MPRGGGNEFALEDWLDAEFARHWSAAGVVVEPCDDATFLRRTYLDLVGRIPSVAEVRDFLADPASDKRTKLVDRLLVDPENSSQNTRDHAEHLARIWRRMMIPPGTNGPMAGRQFDLWLEEQFRDNARYDELTRRLITMETEGENAASPAMFYQAIGATPEESAGEISRVFLGVRLACAQCHDHPFTEWKQSDFWGMAAFFSGPQTNPQDGTVQQNATPGKIRYEDVEYAAKVLWSEKPASIPKNDTPREVLAEWMTDADNPNFAATAVNRVWQHLFGRGLVAGVDDLDLASEEERAVLLDELARKFIDSGFDLRWLIAGICKSQVYQCRTVNDPDDDASPFLGLRPLKTLTPEQMFDSLEQALALPVTRTSEEAARHNGTMVQMLMRLDESAAATPADYSAGVPQVLMLMNGELMSEATSLDSSRTLRAVVDAPFLGAVEKIDTLYLAAFTRRPTESERAVLLKHVEGRETREQRRTAYGEIFWAILNSPEFVLCR